MKDQIDEQLVVVYREGKQTQAGQDAFAILLHRYERRLERILVDRLRGDWDAAQDLVQQTFIKLASRIDDFDPSLGTFSNWVFFCGINTFRDEYRKRRSRKTRTNWFSRSEQHQHQDGRHTWEKVDHRQLEPSVYAEQDEFRNLFWSVFSTLNLPQQEAVRLVILQGLSYRDAGEQTGIFYRTLAKRVQVASHKLREALPEPPECGVMLERRQSAREGLISIDITEFLLRSGAA